MKYIDTNIFGYAIENDSKYCPACTAILEDIESGALKAATSHLTLVELIGVIQKISKEIKRKNGNELDLSKNIDAIMSYPIAWIDINLFTIKKATAHTHNAFGFDCVHLASMELLDIKEIISADTDFDNIPGIKRIDPLEYKTRR